MVCAVFPPMFPVAPLWPGATELACVPSPCSQGGRRQLCSAVGVDSGHMVKVWLWVVSGGSDFGGLCMGLWPSQERPLGPCKYTVRSHPL